MKLRSNILRTLVFLLCFAMILPAFAACAKDGKEMATKEGEETGATVEDDGFVKDNIPEGLNFNDEFLILSAKNQKTHFYAEETDETTVGQAIFARNRTVEERLGIELKWNHQPCFATEEKNTFAKMIETDIQAGNEIDCVVSYNLVPYMLAINGYCENLAKTPYIDLEMPWWPKEYLGTMLYKEQIFALVDNAGVGTLSNLSCIFFNNDLLESRGLESPYDLVANNEWTIPKLKELIAETYEDLDNTQSKTDADMYGLCTSTYARVTCWYYGAGIRFSDLDDNGELVLNTDVEEISNKLNAIIDLFNTEDSLLYEKEQYVMFREQRAYFYLCVLDLCTNLVNKNVEVNYGVAPNPKFNSEQDRYYTHMPNTHDTWFIPTGVDSLECSSAFIECMASEAYRQVNPVYFETNLKVRYAPDERLAEMYDLIRESITFDFVYIYQAVMGGDCNDQIRNCIKNPTGKNWATRWAEIKGKVETNFQSVLDTYDQRAEEN